MSSSFDDISDELIKDYLERIFSLLLIETIACQIKSGSIAYSASIVLEAEDIKLSLNFVVEKPYVISLIHRVPKL